MSNVILPKRFEEKLLQSDKFAGIVKSTLSSFGDILKENKLFFFEEYTDHGIKHIESVLEASDKLITDDTFNKILTFKDIAYFTLSVILHDIGMQIDIDGFVYLIKGGFDENIISDLDSKKWSELWKDFLNDARKFNGKQLKALFGNENTLIEIPNLDDKESIVGTKKKLIGEFIRRNHPRLAHEIALYGFPFKDKTLHFGIDLGYDEKNIIGLIARSHGMNLRPCLDYIYSKFSREGRIVEGVHAVYLMILLRIGDYLQISDNRIYQATLDYRTFISPFSKLEHHTHYSIENIDLKYQDDPERIYVNAKPIDSNMYLKIDKLINDIQYEFDISWAILGELYGRLEQDESCRIKYRRITSNIIEKTYISKLNYVPDNFSITSSDDISKILIAPLYGNYVTYGVRELLQNAVDACKDREQIEIKSNMRYISEIYINIIKQDEDYYFSIRDNGTGMDLHVIKEYFLRAGASFKNSYDWRERNIDDEGKSLIRRTGRFGIGILASFLIGENIEVKTKKVGQKNGYRFSTNLYSEQVNIYKDDSIEVGTEIRIKISKDKVEQFHISSVKSVNDEIKWYNWYIFNKPKVSYISDLNPSRFKINKKNIPDEYDKLPILWTEIKAKGYNKVLWSYKNSSNICLIHNGFIIPDIPGQYLNYGLLSKMPLLNIFDHNGHLPLSLDRNRIEEKLSFSNELLEDLYKDLIAYILVFNEVSVVKNKHIENNSYEINHSALEDHRFEDNKYYYGGDSYEDGFLLQFFLRMILVSKNGFIINYNYFINKLNGIKLIFLITNNLRKLAFDFDLEDRFFYKTTSELHITQYFPALIQSRKLQQLKKTKIIFKEELFEEFIENFTLKEKDKEKSKDIIKLKEVLKIKNRKDGYVHIHNNNSLSNINDDKFISKYKKYILLFREHQINKSTYNGDELLNSLLQKYIGNDVVIPFDISDRIMKYPLAFKELNSYMKKHTEDPLIHKMKND